MHRGRGKVIEHKSDEIENRRRLQSHRVTSRSQLLGFNGKVRFPARPFGEFLWMNLSHIGRIRFGPTRCGVFLHGDGKLRMRFAVCREQATRIPHGRLALPA